MSIKNIFDFDDELNLDDLNLHERQRNAIKKLDMANQFTIIRALREAQEQRNSNYGEQYAENNRSSIVDGIKERIDESNNYSLANQNRNNEIFNRVLRKTLAEEGNYED